MTTGTTTTDQRYNVAFVNPNGSTTWTKAGRLIQKSWTGGDAVTATTPRSSFPKFYYSPGPSRGKAGEIHRASKHEAYLKWLEKRKAFYDARREKRKAEKLMRRKAKAVLPPKPYWKWVKDQKFSPIIYNDKRLNPLYQRTFSSEPGDPWQALFDTVDPAQEYKCIEKLRRKAYGSGFNPAVFTAEGRKAFNMIGDSAMMLRFGIGSLLKSDWRGVAAAFTINPKQTRKIVGDPRRTLADKWLILQYGWLPLVSDMERGAQWLAEALRDPIVGRTKLVARRTWQTVQVAPTQAAGIGWTERQIQWQLQYIIYGFKKSPTMVPSIQTVATVAWELLPYSFVADWVIPISSYLEACRTASDLQGTVVRSLKQDVRYTKWTCSPNAGFVGFLAPIGGPTKRLVRFDRTISDEISPPNPIYGVAEDLTFLSWRRAANAVALLAQKKWELFPRDLLNPSPASRPKLSGVKYVAASKYYRL